MISSFSAAFSSGMPIFVGDPAMTVGLCSEKSMAVQRRGARQIKEIHLTLTHGGTLYDLSLAWAGEQRPRDFRPISISVSQPCKLPIRGHSAGKLPVDLENNGIVPHISAFKLHYALWLPLAFALSNAIGDFIGKMFHDFAGGAKDITLVQLSTSMRLV